MGMSGYDATLQGASFGSFSGIQSIEWAGLDGETMSYKELSDTDRFLNKIAGSVDPGTVNVTLTFDATQYASVLAARGGANEAWTLTFSDNSTIVCDGHIKTPGSTNINPDSVMTHTVVIELSGNPTVTPA